jgi:hypothetical protein
MRRQEIKDIHWHRILGRLQRRVSLLMHSHGNPSGDNRPLETCLTIPEEEVGIDIGPMDVGPTDPEVYRARARITTPPPERIYAVPQELTPAAVAPTDTLLHRILQDIEDDMGVDVVGDVRPSGSDAPPPTYANAVAAAAPSRPPSPACSEVENTYVDMRAGTQRGRVGPRTPPAGTSRPPPSSGAIPRQGNAYNSLEDPQRYVHAITEGVRIPQGSPPMRATRDVPLPAYYRDYLHPDAFPSYSLICMYAWYVQVTRDVIMCKRCVTDEHTFCIFNRPRAVWRHIHIISRTFQHTDLHCCRCYKLLLKTRRAIDCYTCRQNIIDLRGKFGDLNYKIICDTTVPRGII